MRKLFVILMGCVLLSACSSSGKADYSQLLAQKTSSYSSVKEAIQGEAATPLSINKKHNVKLRISDPAIRDGDVLNSFQVLAVDLVKGQNYKFKTGTTCYECLGYRKKVLFPKVQLFNQNYKKISEIKTHYSRDAIGNFGSTNFKINNTGKHYVFVSSDNKRLDEELTMPMLPVYTGGALSLIDMNVSVSPEGNVAIWVKEDD